MSLKTSLKNAVENLPALTAQLSLHGNRWPWSRIDVIEPNTATRAWYEVDLRRDDHALERWGKFYRANGLHTCGVLFETFMLDPPAIAEALNFHKPPLPAGEDFYPLLPAQRRAVARSAPADDEPVFLKRQAD